MALELADGLIASEADRLLQAEALVRSYCGWHIAPTSTDTLSVRGSGGRAQILPSLHVTEVVSVTQDDADVTSDEYDWSEAGVLTNRHGRWCGRVLRIEFTHGHAEPPPEVTAIVQAVAQRALANPGSLVRTQDGPFSDTYSQSGFNQSLPMALLDAEKDVLARYRIPSRP